MRPEGLSMKNSIDTIGNRTSDLPAHSAVPEPSAPNAYRINKYDSDEICVGLAVIGSNI